MQQTLRGVGEWLRVNGEAIYGTRPWETFKDGNVRFTRKGNTLYAIALEWPEEELRLTSLAGKPVLNVELLGSSEAIAWKAEPDALVIQPPSRRPCKYAYAFRITCRSL
jgi:alpha-L-fucosidase